MPLEGITDDLRRRRLTLLYELYRRNKQGNDGGLQNAAMALGREPGTLDFEFDKARLIEEGAIERVDMPPGYVPEPELYKVTAKGENMLGEAGYELLNDN